MNLEQPLNLLYLRRGAVHEKENDVFGFCFEVRGFWGEGVFDLRGEGGVVQERRQRHHSEAAGSLGQEFSPGLRLSYKSVAVCHMLSFFEMDLNLRANF